MRLTRTTAWIGGAVLLALVLVAATWLLLVSPRQQLAADLRDQAASTAAQNDLLAAQVAQLQLELGDVPKTRAEVAELREQVPADAELATLLRQVTDLAARSGATLTGVTPSEPAAAADPGAVAPVEPVAPDGTTTTPVTAAPGVEVVPVTITATGSFAQLQELLRLVQVDLPRAVLVRSVALTGGEPGGDLQLSLTADAFALPTTPQEEQLAALVAAGATPLTTGELVPSPAPTSPGFPPRSGTEVPAPTATEVPVPMTTAAPLDAAAPPTPEETL
ncbi:hypothetical protein [uncultured Pseudokineococcus sp.]|uniref:hypothetical protein n=1 Tax=uncultured Pseudokineococcus sp. TaxID=1642928 RepID=UPI00262CF850|nr:hypothetical protein [uncultured Pseudokineococcus sp.]